MISFRNGQINIYSHDVARLAGFYEQLGFQETFRTPEHGMPIHVELSLDQFKLGVASVEAARADHGVKPQLGGRPVEIVLWTEDVDRDHQRLTAERAPSLSPPHDSSPAGCAPPGSPTQTATRSSSCSTDEPPSAYDTRPQTVQLRRSRTAQLKGANR